MNLSKYLDENYLVLRKGSRGEVIVRNEKEEFAKILKDCQVEVGVEIGVEKGYFSEQLCKSIEGLKLYGVDSWQAYKGYGECHNQEEQDRRYESAKNRLIKFDCELIKGYSVEVAKRFEDESLDFVYIDANHEFKYCVEDIAEWSKKVKKGGIVSGHDYSYNKVKGELMHVKYVVDAWTRAYEISQWFSFGSIWFWQK